MTLGSMNHLLLTVSRLEQSEPFLWQLIPSFNRFHLHLPHPKPHTHLDETVAYSIENCCFMS
jgi:hypothetical protein